MCALIINKGKKKQKQPQHFQFGSQKSLDGKRHGDVEDLSEAVATRGKARHVVISGAQQEQRGLAGDKTSTQNRWDRKFERWMGMRSLQKLKCQSNDFLLH